MKTKTKSTLARRRVKRRQDRVSHKKLRTLRSRKYARKTARKVMRGGEPERVALNRSINYKVVTVDEEGKKDEKTDTLINVFGTKLSEKTSFFGQIKTGSYVLKIAIDINKCRQFDDNDKVYAKRDDYGISSSGANPPHMNELINGLLIEVFEPTEPVKIAETMPGILTHLRALRTQQTMNREFESTAHPVYFDRQSCIPHISRHLFYDGTAVDAATNCNIEIHFKPDKTGFVITDIKYTTIQSKLIKCYTRWGDDLGQFPVYQMQEFDDLKIHLNSYLKEEGLIKKLTETKTDPFYASAVIETLEGSDGKVHVLSIKEFYGFNAENVNKNTNEASDEIIKVINEKKKKKKKKKKTKKKK